MSPRGYTSALLVAREMATDLTAEQLDQCANLIEAAELEVDRETGRSWLTTSPVTNELHTIEGRHVYLNHRPVTAVTAVSARPLSVGGAATTLTAGVGYELIDAANGILLLSGYGYPTDVVINTEYDGYHGYLLSVTYTYSAVMDPAIQKLTTELVATWMRGRTSGGDFAGVESIKLPDFAITYSDAAAGLEVPPDLRRRLRMFEKVLFA